MTQIFVKYILHLCIFRHLKLEIALAIPASKTKNRTPTPVYLDPGMHSGLEVKGLSPHDALKHHFTSLKRQLISQQLEVLGGKLPWDWFTNTW